MTPEWMDGLKTICRCRHTFQKTGVTWGIFLSPDTLLDAAQRLFQTGFFLEDISGLDSADGFAAIYHLSVYSGADRVTLYVILPHDDLRIPSISAVYSGAEWHERETMDFFGIHFTGHPDPKPLLLPEDMTDHPLIKEDKDRALLKDLLDPGDMVERDPDFLLFEEGDSPVRELKSQGQGPDAVEKS